MSFKIQKGSLIKYTGVDEHVIIPEEVTKIKEGAFKGCQKTTAITAGRGVTSIDRWAFDRCPYLTAVIIPGNVTKISGDAFFECPKITIICEEGSCAHRYAVKKHIAFLFDYQYEAFNGVIPPGLEMLSSPFLADEEKPYIFISYSHADRGEVLSTIKDLYESGWKVWYDEGLTIGDKYDETLEDHVRNCAAFLLFVTENSLESIYVRENEIPWAIDSGRPIIQCIAGEGLDYEIDGGLITDRVSPSEIESALEKVEGLEKGERREAKGISVAVDPAAREAAAGGGFAYCIYANESAVTAKSILLEAQNSGCVLYNAAEDGENDEKLQSSACLVVFLDQAFLAEARLRNLLIKEYKAKKDIAVCLLKDISDEDLPEELLPLHLMQWLNFVHGINLDMITKLERHLQKKGCRNAAALPGFDYKKTKEGIVISRYKGMSPEAVIDSEYSRIPVIEITDNAFKNCVHLTNTVIPEHVTVIGENAFSGCTALKTITIPEGLREIRSCAFEDCKVLDSFDIPDNVTVIGEGAFRNCLGLRSITIPGEVKCIGKSAFSFCQRLNSVRIREGVNEIGASAFRLCRGLESVEIPQTVTVIGDEAFSHTKLASVNIPDGVTRIGAGAFSHCSNLVSVTIPNGITKIEKEVFCCTGLTSIDLPETVTEIGDRAFLSCEKLVSVNIPNSVRIIRYEAFRNCRELRSITIPDSVEIIEYNVFGSDPDLRVICSPGSFAWKYCGKNSVKRK